MSNPKGIVRFHPTYGYSQQENVQVGMIRCFTVSNSVEGAVVHVGLIFKRTDGMSDFVDILCGKSLVQCLWVGWILPEGFQP